MIPITTFFLIETVIKTHTYRLDWQFRAEHAASAHHKHELSRLYRVKHV